ncbi:LamG-like jellyroll fold domain-containing protein [Lentzea sp. BCCO 10_0061]|uniref:LamG-like jellyroll fold domain-containing protein n=1 Tax=Lentzea sokolovensis TaxID=3095429 RepID=A0ABU4VCL8_9PSEU|nr:LamG-like jellyroll fold domain-containing protein [Lentzea sp. BCCO 10_0061]MDX8149512.1 LamG-like jellyroll fold domain-containing protein [Lentzea sp. BCCO 10_0061]
MSITWPFGALPTPVLSGPEATYTEVLPGVDLKLTASVRGFSQLLVVKNREAAENSKLDKVRFGFATTGVTAHPAGGGLEAKDASGRVVFMSPTPLMWDSGGAGAAGVPAKAAVAEPEGKRTATMPVAVENGEITVVPDAAMLSDAATRYPVMIDPSWTGRVADNAWTLVSSKDPGTAYWQGRNNQGNDYLQNSGIVGNAGTGQTCDSVSADGLTCLSAKYKTRSYFRMDTSEVKGKVVSGASFRVEQRWAWGCNNGGSNATIRVTSEFGGGTTWNNQPGWWGDDWAASAAANRKYGATHGCAGPGDVEFDFTRVVKQAATDNWGYITLVMHVDESSVNYWKRFNAGSAVLAIDYNSIPDAPGPLTADGKACATGDARPAVPTSEPTIRGRISDPDPGDTMKARFEWRRIRPNGSHGPISQVERSPWGNVTTAEYSLPKPSTLPTGVVESSDTLISTGDWDNNGRTDLLIRDLDGYLYLLPTEVKPGGWRSGDRVEIGSGWEAFTIAGVADWDKDGKQDIVARDNTTGVLWLYPGKANNEPSPLRVQLGSIWNSFTFAGLADYDRDGKQDLIARDADGVLYLYPGDGTRAPSTQPRIVLGNGWQTVSFFGVIDRTGEGAPDIFAEHNGTIWLYLGSGKREPYSGNPARYDIGSGWAGAMARTITDFNADGANDIVAKLPGSADWLLYPGVVGTGYGASPWAVAGHGLTTGNYAYRMTANDMQLWGAASSWCEFSVDVTPPDAPTFGSTVYKTSGCPTDGCGALGIADTFTFASTSADVEYFRWGFTDPPSMRVAKGTRVRWTPPSSGPKTLFVEAVDYAGLPTRRTFDFTVAGDKPNEAQWFTADDPAFDAAGNGHELTLTGLDTGRSGRAVGGLGAIGFDGVADNGATTTKVLDTSKDFSVSAWVRLTGDTVNRTVVSQQGSATSAFRLGYEAADHKWVFALAETDTANPQLKTAKSDAPASAGVWTHLTGTVDSVNKDVRLYVDGALQLKTDVVKDGFAAAGQVWIGKAMRNSAPVEPWLGDVAEVRAWNRAITPQETLQMAEAYEVGRWLFDEGSGSIADDYTQFRRALKLNLAGGAKWGVGVQPGHSLELNGAGGSASTNEPVLNTDQSFSVDVWVKLNATGTPRTVVVQRGPSGVDPFTLKYDGSQWSAEMPNVAVNPSTWWKAKGDAVVNKWTHLVATYDAGARTLKLSVGYKVNEEQENAIAVDVLKSTVTGVVGWNSTGVLSVGRSSAGEYFSGNIDELKAYQGVLAPRALETQALQGSSLSGDARDEIISVDANGNVRAFLNVSDTAVYPNDPQVVGSGFAADHTWFADINGDGKSEIIAVEPNGAIKAFKNVNGMNGFPFGDVSVIGSAPGETSRIRFADIDGDGRADRVSIDVDGRVRVYRNLFGLNELGQATAFATTPVIVGVLATGVTPDRVRFADVNGDKKAEFITVNVDQSVSVFRNLGGLGYGSYDTSQDVGYGWTPDRTWFADINGDGKAEIISIGTDGTVWSFRNVDGLDSRTGFPYTEEPKQLGWDWNEPGRAFFS